MSKVAIRTMTVLGTVLAVILLFFRSAKCRKSAGIDNAIAPRSLRFL